MSSAKAKVKRKRAKGRRKRLNVSFVLTFAFLLFPFSFASAAGRVECSTVAGKALGRAVRYCALLPPSYDAEKTRRYPVLYYLHGLGDNQQTMVNSGGWNLIEQLQAEGKIGEFLVVTPEGGGSFYVNSRDGNVHYEDFFITEFLPAIERKYRVRTGRANRGISGMSMGGYGALRFAFKYPKLFGSVSAHSAALMEDLPESVAAAGVGRRGEVLGDVFGRPLDRAFFRSNSPFSFAAGSNLRGLKIYFDCGLSDEYGFDAGAQALHNALRKRGIPHEFHLYPGGHDWLYLIQHLDDSLQFHSRAFFGK